MRGQQLDFHFLVSSEELKNKQATTRYNNNIKYNAGH